MKYMVIKISHDLSHDIFFIKIFHGVPHEILLIKIPHLITHELYHEYIVLIFLSHSGKSTVIDLVTKWIQSILQQPGDSPDQPYVLKTAFTGTAASNIGGQTLTSTFRFGYNNQHQCFSDKERDRRKMQLKKLVCVIIDEVSMVKSDMLYMLNLKLQEIMENKRPFGGVAVFLLGDIFQLKPICGRYIF